MVGNDVKEAKLLGKSSVSICFALLCFALLCFALLCFASLDLPSCCLLSYYI